MSEDNIKEKIIQATIDLMKKDNKSFTVRKIAAHAGITQGLINYHFQTKDNLIDIAAQHVVDETISKVPDILMQIDGTYTDKLRKMMKMTLNYLVKHPNLSRISILRDMQSGHINDNTQSSINAFDKILQHIITDEKKRFLAGHVFCAAVQSLFLRSDVLLKTQDLDIFDTEIQSQFIDSLIDMALGGLLDE